MCLSLLEISILRHDSVIVVGFFFFGIVDVMMLDFTANNNFLLTLFAFVGLLALNVYLGSYSLVCFGQNNREFPSIDRSMDWTGFSGSIWHGRQHENGVTGDKRRDWRSNSLPTFRRESKSGRVFQRDPEVNLGIDDMI